MPKKIEDMSEAELAAHIETYTPVIGQASETFWNEPDIGQAAVNLAANTKLQVETIMKTGKLPKQGGIMQFSYETETVTVGDHVFVVREISNGENEKLQRDFFGDVSLSTKKDNLERQLNQKRVNFPELAQLQNFAAIESWTYKGEAVPLEIANWRNCPKRVADAVEKVIERLNPSDSEEFPDGHGDGSES